MHFELLTSKFGGLEPKISNAKHEQTWHIVNFCWTEPNRIKLDQTELNRKPYDKTAVFEKQMYFSKQPFYKTAVFDPPFP